MRPRIATFNRFYCPPPDWVIEGNLFRMLTARTTAQNFFCLGFGEFRALALITARNAPMLHFVGEILGIGSPVQVFESVIIADTVFVCGVNCARVFVLDASEGLQYHAIHSQCLLSLAGQAVITAENDHQIPTARRRW